jgi:hypothetical protein
MLLFFFPRHDAHKRKKHRVSVVTALDWAVLWHRDSTLQSNLIDRRDGGRQATVVGDGDVNALSS